MGPSPLRTRGGILDCAYKLPPPFGRPGLIPHRVVAAHQPLESLPAMLSPRFALGPTSSRPPPTRARLLPNLLGRPEVPWAPTATAASPQLARHNLHGRRRHASQPARPATFIPTLPIRARAARAYSAPSPRPDTIGSTTVQRPAHGPPFTKKHGKGTSVEKENRRDSHAAETKAPCSGKPNADETHQLGKRRSDGAKFPRGLRKDRDVSRNSESVQRGRTKHGL